MANDPQNASDPRNANHHWFPFLRYQQQCLEQGKEATVDGWLRENGKLKHQEAYEAAKAAAAANKTKTSTATKPSQAKAE